MEFLREALTGKNRFVLRVAIIAAIGGFLFGYDTGIVGQAMPHIEDDFGNVSTFTHEAIVSCLLIGAAVGAILSGWTSQKIGRKYTKVGSGTVYVIGAVGAALSPNAFWLIVARFVLGLAVGTASFVSPMYISELTPKRIRGGVTSFNQIMITSGILLAFIVGSVFTATMGTDAWRWMFAVAAIPGAALAVGMLFQPQSPRWLVEQGRIDEAREVLARTREEDRVVDEELEDIQEAASKEGSVRDIFRPNLRPVLYIGLSLAIFQQFIGINTVIYYAPRILQFAGFSDNASIYASSIVGVTNVLATIVAVLLLDSWGRRKLLLSGTALCVIALAALGAFFALGGGQGGAGWLAMGCLVVYIIGFAIGLGPVFWLMISEVFPLRVRGPGMSISTVANWLSNFLISLTFLTVISGVGRAGGFWIYAGLGVVAWLYFYARIPETKQKELEQIEREIGVDVEAEEDRGVGDPERAEARPLDEPVMAKDELRDLFSDVTALRATLERGDAEDRDETQHRAQGLEQRVREVRIAVESRVQGLRSRAQMHEQMAGGHEARADELETDAERTADALRRDELRAQVGVERAAAERHRADARDFESRAQAELARLREVDRYAGGDRPADFADRATTLRQRAEAAEQRAREASARAGGNEPRDEDA